MRFFPALLLSALAGMLVVILGLSVPAFPSESRVIWGVYNSGDIGEFEAPNAQVYFELPLNHLGMKMELIDVANALPSLDALPHGVVLNVRSVAPERLTAYWKWVQMLINRGVYIVVLDSLGPAHALRGPTLANLGITLGPVSSSFPPHISVVSEDARAYPFERPIAHETFQFDEVHVSEGDVLLTLRHTPTNATASPAALLPKGGILISGYAVNLTADGTPWQYYIDPFFFLNEAFDLQQRPRPDITTINGRRLFYTHIDGDGLINPTYFDRGILSGEAIHDRVLKKYPQIPFTVSVITAEVNPTYKGSDESIALSQKLFALDNVEPATHTFSHPLMWDRRIVPKETVDNYNREVRIKTFSNDALLSWRLPGYAFSPYAETRGSIDYINGLLAPKDKPARLVLWSGNTKPNEATLKVTAEEGLLNMNGGDSRFDGQHPSYLGLSSFYRKVGPYYQIYSANANENLYTDLWSTQFGAFRNVIQTFENTDRPRRVSAMNVYYHHYSGERVSALSALEEIYDYALTQPIFPVYASRYVETVHGFISAEIASDGTNRWVVQNTGALQTVRFDLPSANVDMLASKGVVGYQHINESLYVFLADTPTSLIVLGDAKPSVPTLKSSNHDLADLKISDRLVSYTTVSMGPVDAVWAGFAPGSQYQLRFTGRDNRGRWRVRASESGRLRYGFNSTGNVRVRIEAL